MKSIRTTCRNCHGRMKIEKCSAYYRLSCPFCGTVELLTGNDRVQVAQIQADTERLEMVFSYRAHQDYLAEVHIRRKIQIAIICVLTLIAAILTWIFMTLIS